jgi:hypothetical protein
MSAMLPTQAREKTEEKATNVGRFLAKRGILMVKEFRDMLAVSGDYGGKIRIASVILSSAKSTHGDVQYGIKLEQTDEDGDIRASGFLDYDELPEIISAFDFLDGVAQQMVDQERDYTEVTYLTKDNLKFGFYQMEGEQQAFVDVGGYGQSLFLLVSSLQLLKESIEAAKAHLISRGADSKNVNT